MVAVALCASCGGCVWMPDFDDPEPQSYPPEIDRTKVTEPPLDLLAVINGETPFSVANAVSDPDSPVDLLFYAWFLGIPEEFDARPVKTGRGASSWVLNPCREPVWTVLRQSGPHLLEVVVVDEDSALATDATGWTVTQTVDGEVVPGKYAYAAWMVEYAGGCP